MLTCRCGRSGRPHVKTDRRTLRQDRKILCAGCAVVMGYTSVEREASIWLAGRKK